MKKVMKLIGRIIKISLILAVVAGAAIYGYLAFFVKGEVKYSLSGDGTYYVVSGFQDGAKYGKVTEIDVPETYKGLPVKGIADDAFGTSEHSDVELLEVISLPDTLEAIGSGAFTGTGYYQDQSNWKIEYDSDGKELYRSLYIGKYLIEVKFNGEALLTDNGKCRVVYTVEKGTLGIAEAAFKSTYTSEYDYVSINIQDSLSFAGADCYYAGNTGGYVIPTLDEPDSVFIQSSRCYGIDYERIEINYNGTVRDWARFENKVKEMLDSGRTQTFDGDYKPENFTKYVINCTDAHLKEDNVGSWIVSH